MITSRWGLLLFTLAIILLYTIFVLLVHGSLCAFVTKKERIYHKYFTNAKLKRFFLKGTDFYPKWFVNFYIIYFSVVLSTIIFNTTLGLVYYYENWQVIIVKVLGYIVLICFFIGLPLLSRILTLKKKKKK